MGSARRKTVLWLAGLSLMVVAIFAWQPIIERWCIYRLGSEDIATVDYAATILGEMTSIRAIVPLIEQIPREIAKGRSIRWRYHLLGNALHTRDRGVGGHAVVALVLEDGRDQYDLALGGGERALALEDSAQGRIGLEYGRRLGHDTVEVGRIPSPSGPG